MYVSLVDFTMFTFIMVCSNCASVLSPEVMQVNMVISVMSMTFVMVCPTLAL
jgi:hypothetical protein